MENIGDRIRFLMNEAGLKQYEFAKRISISPPSLNVMLKGTTEPSPQTATIICKEFGVSKEWLLYGTGEMRPSYSVAESVSNFIGNILHDEDEFKLKLITALAAMNESDWETLKKLFSFVNNSSNNVEQ